jgi:hypothetical protein
VRDHPLKPLGKSLVQPRCPGPGCQVLRRLALDGYPPLFTPSALSSLTIADGASDTIHMPQATFEARRHAWESKLDLVLLVAATLAMAAAVGFLVYTVLTQISVYRALVTAELSRPGPVDHAAMLAYTRSGDFAVAKFAALFLGFTLIFLGAAYTLRMARVSYEFSVSKENAATAALSTSSPGLVMVSLGVLLVALTVLTQSSVDLHQPSRATFRIIDDNAD